MIVPTFALPPEIIALAKREWKLFPLCRHDDESYIERDRGKVPPRGFVKWHHRATSDLVQLASWAREYPGCNWAVATGAGSGVVVDVDGQAGRDARAELQKEGFIFPPTLTVTTGREDGGEHLYYQPPPDTDIRNNNSGKVAPHIDVRGTGGYVVAVSSTHVTGRQYRFDDPDIPIAPLPEWVIDRMRRPAARPSAVPVGDTEKVGEGGRTNRMVKMAGTMHKRGMSPQAIAAALLVENAAKCDPPLVEQKVRDIAADIVRRYPPGTPEDDRPHEFSDDALALQFTSEHGDDLRYTAAWAKWSRWDATYWRKDDTLHVFDLARAICRDAATGVDRPHLAAHITSAQTIAAVERLARSDRRHAATVDLWDANLWLLNTPGGVVDLRTGKLRPAVRWDYMTKITAVAPGGDCPLWRAFLKRIMHDEEELQLFLQRMCGYALTGVTHEEALFFTQGTGANGKSKFIGAVTGAMGDYAKTAPTEMFLDSRNERHPTDLAGLQGARLVTAIEMEKGRRWAESKIKALTGGDRITARYMRQDFFEYTPQFKLLIAGNHKPSLRTVDEAMRRRFNLIPFTVTIPEAERDLKFADKLQEEWPGILRWMVEGCLMWQAHGLQAPKAVRDATAQYLAAEDVMARWIEERCVVKGTLWTSSSDLFADWRNWCEENGEFAGSQRSFSQTLESRGFILRPKNTGRGFRGIGLCSGNNDGGQSDTCDTSPIYPRHAHAYTPNTDNASQASPYDTHADGTDEKEEEAAAASEPEDKEWV
jgi:putative DNA primase/helicase